MVIVFADVRDERRMTDSKKVDQASQDGYGAIEDFVRALAEKVGEHGVAAGWRLFQLIGDSNQEHRLALARVAFDP